MNATLLSTGVVAEATFNVSSAAPATALNIASALGASGTATAMPMAGLGSASITITPAVTIQSLSCAPAMLGAGQSTSCTVTIAGQATATQLAVASTSPALTVPSQISIAGGSTTAKFSASANPVTASTAVQISAGLNGAAKTASIQLLPPAQLSSLNCGTSAAPGATVLCTAAIDGLQQTTASMTLSSSTASIKIPASVTVRPGQSTIWFNAAIDPAATTQAATITAVLGSNTAVAPVGIQAINPYIAAPAARSFPIGRATSFTVTATDPLALPTSISVTNLPAGAKFSANSGTFWWLPTASQEGFNQITFTATDSQGHTASATTSIEVGDGKPFVTGVTNAASERSDLVCSPGSLAQAQGVYFGSASTVIVNGASQPIMTPRENTVNFACPDGAAGASLSIVVQNSAGSSAPITSTLQTIAPGIFTNGSNGTGPAQVVLAGTAVKIGVADSATVAEQALPGDPISIYVTGINPVVANTLVTISGVPANVTAITPAAGQPGIYKVTCTVPAAAQAGPAVPVIVTSTGPDGSTMASNTATLALAPPAL